MFIWTLHANSFIIQKMSLRNIINNLTLEHRKESVLRVVILSQASKVTLFSCSRRSQFDFLLKVAKPAFFTNDSLLGEENHHPTRVSVSDFFQSY
jgi:hypothetical protein